MRNHDKLAAAAHLIISRLRPEQLGATKLNKILWFADCEFYRRHGHSLTGQSEYLRQGQGPCAAGLEQALTKLKATGAIREEKVRVLTHYRREFHPVMEPDVDQDLTTEEVDILLSTALALSSATAAEVSELSHDDLWLATDRNGAMSVEAGSVIVLEPEPDEVEWANRAFANG